MICPFLALSGNKEMQSTVTHRPIQSSCKQTTLNPSHLLSCNGVRNRKRNRNDKNYHP